MKILFVHHRYHTNLFNWFRGFQQNGHSVRLLVYKPDDVDHSDLPTSTYLKPSKWSIKKMKSNPRTRGDGEDSFSPYYYPSIKTLYKYFKSEKPDMVIIRPAFSRFAYLTLICTLIFRTKRVFYSQIKIHKAYPKHKLFIFNLMMGLLNAHWISPCLGDIIEHPKAPPRMVYFPFVMPVLTTKSGYLKETNNICFLSVAKYFKSKNPKLALEVFLELCPSYDHIQLTICGTGDKNGYYFKEMQETVDGSDFKNRIKLLINRSYNEVQELYKTHDVFVLPSRHDPAAITNLEAMGYGLPVICSMHNGTAFYTNHGKTGFVFEKKNELYEWMNKFASQKGILNEFKRNTIDAIEKNHDPVLVTSQVLDKLL